MKRFQISEEEYQGIKAAEKATKDKNVSRRLRVLMLRFEGSTTTEAAKATGMSRVNVSLICKRYQEQGLEEFVRNKYTSHRRALTEEQENKILERFEKAAEAGQEVTAMEIKGAFDEARGKDTGSGYIYMLLKRHGWRKVMPRSRHPKAASEEACEASKKLKTCVLETRKNMQPNSRGRVRLMFQDEAGFGRINKPKRCWCSKKTRPAVPCHHIREYRYAYGAVEPTTGKHFFLVLPRCDTICMNVFLAELSVAYPDNQILLVCDGASWHRSKGLNVPDNIKLLRIPPYTPEMNPIEQIWKQLRAMGFKNEIFKTLNHVVDRLCDTICRLTDDLVKSITCRHWIECCDLD